MMHVLVEYRHPQTGVVSFGLLVRVFTMYNVIGVWNGTREVAIHIDNVNAYTNIFRGVLPSLS